MRLGPIIRMASKCVQQFFPVALSKTFITMTIILTILDTLKEWSRLYENEVCGHAVGLKLNAKVSNVQRA
jgi:hypothetical protein